MADATPFFSLIIPTYNRRDPLMRCLHGVAEMDYPRDRFEVIVVDDGSAASSESIVESFRDEFRALWIGQSNGGPAAARNTGASRAGGEFLAFTDDDCIPSRQWLRVLATVVAADPLCMVGGSAVNVCRDNVYSSASQLIIDLVYAYYNGDPNAGRFFATNNLALPADGFRALGGFDAGFRTSEDRDLCARWLASGSRMIYAPNAVVSHAHVLTWRTFCRQHFEYGRGAFRLHKKNARCQNGYSVVDPGFYGAVARLAGQRLRQLSKRRAVALAGLLIAWQLASATGWVREAIVAAFE
jgi:glycosyltransferase involved in cell wall biosynthesis